MEDLPDQTPPSQLPELEEAFRDYCRAHGLDPDWLCEKAGTGMEPAIYIPKPGEKYTPPTQEEVDASVVEWLASDPCVDQKVVQVKERNMFFDNAVTFNGDPADEGFDGRAMLFAGDVSRYVDHVNPDWPVKTQLTIPFCTVPINVLVRPQHVPRPAPGEPELHSGELSALFECNDERVFSYLYDIYAHGLFFLWDAQCRKEKVAPTAVNRLPPITPRATDEGYKRERICTHKLIFDTAWADNYLVAYVFGLLAYQLVEGQKACKLPFSTEIHTEYEFNAGMLEICAWYDAANQQDEYCIELQEDGCDLVEDTDQ